MMKHVCAYCGVVFESKELTAKCCSRTCANRLMNAERALTRANVNAEKYAALRRLDLNMVDPKHLEYVQNRVDEERGDEQQCMFCGRIFRSSERHKFCSRGCYDAYRALTGQQKRTCLQCGQDFMVGHHGARVDQYCSPTCRDAFVVATQNTTLPATLWAGVHVCVNCGAEFWTVHTHGVLFCSWACEQEFARRQAVHDVTCVVCGKVFTTSIATRTCSARCAAADRLNKMTPEQRRARFVKASAARARAVVNGGCGSTRFVSGFFADLGHYVRSGWEYNFAKILNALGRVYEYEPRTFTLAAGDNYVPDFYLPARNVYYELKGYWFDRDQFQRFQMEYPEIKIHLLSADNGHYRRLYMHFRGKLRLIPSYDERPSAANKLLTKEEINLLRTKRGKG